MKTIFSRFLIEFLLTFTRNPPNLPILDCFLPFYSPSNPKNPNFEKMKIRPGDIITLHMHTKNENHMIYGSWGMERENVLSFWIIFCPFNPQRPRKTKFWKNEKSAWRYYHFTHVHHKWQSYDVRFLRYGPRRTDRRTDGWADGCRCPT